MGEITGDRLKLYKILARRLFLAVNQSYLIKARPETDVWGAYKNVLASDISSSNWSMLLKSATDALAKQKDSTTPNYSDCPLVPVSGSILRDFGSLQSVPTNVHATTWTKACTSRGQSNNKTHNGIDFEPIDPNLSNISTSARHGCGWGYGTPYSLAIGDYPGFDYRVTKANSVAWANAQKVLLEKLTLKNLIFITAIADGVVDSCSFQWSKQCKSATGYQPMGSDPTYLSKGIVPWHGNGWLIRIKHYDILDNGTTNYSSTWTSTYGDCMSGSSVPTNMPSESVDSSYAGSSPLFFVSTGTSVVAGQPIAVLGTTGTSTTSHLHLGITFGKSKQLLDPLTTPISWYSGYTGATGYLSLNNSENISKKSSVTVVTNGSASSTLLNSDLPQEEFEKLSEVVESSDDSAKALSDALTTMRTTSTNVNKKSLELGQILAKILTIQNNVTTLLNTYTQNTDETNVSGTTFDNSLEPDN